MANVPPDVAFPAAVSCEEELNTVCNTAPFISTCAPETNLLPVTTSVKLPGFTAAGLIPVKTGVGFISVTLLVPLAEESAALVARIVMVFGLGSVAGAVYFPLESIVPVAEDPPAAPFTDQDTPVFDVPDTLALKE